MGENQFGGTWTQNKLECLRKYLEAYRTIFTKNQAARHFTTTYVDAFAGSGQISTKIEHQSSEDLLFADAYEDSEAFAYRDGSTRIALEIKSPFDRYLFVEVRSQSTAKLAEMKVEFGSSRHIEIRTGDANKVMMEWCETTDWSKNRALVFLDPYGMQVEWQLLEAIANTKAIDLWILFPLGVAVNRMLTNRGLPPAAWERALTRTFGSDSWKSRFYGTTPIPTLFELDGIERRTASIDDVGVYFLDRLKNIFHAVAENPLQLINSRDVPIYLLCFAAANPKGAPSAIRIASDIIKRQEEQ